MQGIKRKGKKINSNRLYSAKTNFGGVVEFAKRYIYNAEIILDKTDTSFVKLRGVCK